MPDDKAIVLGREYELGVLPAVQALEIADDAGYQAATGLLTSIKAFKRNAEAERDNVLRPLLDATAAERARWRPVLEAADRNEAEVKQKMVAFVNERQRKEREEAAKIEAKLAAERIKPETAVRQMAAVPQAPKVVAAPSGLGASQVRKRKVVYITEPAKVPDEYWVLDEVRVRKVALAGVEIPGVEVREENTIAGI